MPKVPVYNFQVQGGGAGIGSPDFINLSTPYAREVENIGNMLTNRAAQMLEEYDSAKAYEAYNQLSEASRGKMVELTSRESGAAFGIQKEYEEWERNTRGKIETSTLTAANQGRLFSRLADRHRGDALNSLAGHEAHQTKIYKTEQLKGFADTTERSIRQVAFDPIASEEKIMEYEAADARMFPGHDRTANNAAARQVFRTSQAMELIGKDATYAKQWIEQPKIKSELGDKYDQLKKMLESKAIDNRREATYGFITEKYGRNYEAMSAYVNNKKNWETHGLSYEDAKELDSRFKGLRAERDALESASIADMHRTQDATYSKLLADLDEAQTPQQKELILSQIPGLVRSRRLSPSARDSIRKEILEGAKEDDIDAEDELIRGLAKHEDVSAKAIYFQKMGKLKASTASGYIKAATEKYVGDGERYITGVMTPGDMLKATDARYAMMEAVQEYRTQLKAKNGP